MLEIIAETISVFHLGLIYVLPVWNIQYRPANWSSVENYVKKINTFVLIVIIVDNNVSFTLVLFSHLTTQKYKFIYLLYYWLLQSSGVDREFRGGGVAL